MTDETRPCAWCGHIMHAADHPPYKWQTRQYCCMQCAAFGRNRDRNARRKQCLVTGCEAVAVGRGLCKNHHAQLRRSEIKGVQPPADVAEVVQARTLPATPAMPRTPKRKPVKCVFCEAVRILARDGADAQQTAAAMGKPVWWIQRHLKECTREKRTA